MAGILTVKGGTGAIVEYFGDGADSLSATGKGTICNMGAEIGATCSFLPMMKNERLPRQPIAKKWLHWQMVFVNTFALIMKFMQILKNIMTRLLKLDLDELEPHVNGPFTPDLASPISK